VSRLDASELRSFDLDQLLLRLQHSRQRGYDLTSALVAQLPRQLLALRRCVEAGDVVEIQRRSQRLCNLFESLQASAAAAAADQLSASAASQLEAHLLGVEREADRLLGDLTRTFGYRLLHWYQPQQLAQDRGRRPADP